MDNYDKVLKYTNETMNASGTSTEKYQHHMDSLEATINELQVQWEQFIQELNATNTFKNAIKFVSSLLSVLDALVNKVPVLQTLLGAFVGFKVVKGIVPSILKMATAISKFKGFGNPIKALANSFKSLKVSTSMLSTVYTDMNAKLTAYQKQQAIQIITNKELNMEQKKSRLIEMGLNQTDVELIMSSHSLSAALTTLGQKYGEIYTAGIRAVLASDTLTNEQKEQKISTILLSTAQRNNKVVTEEQAMADAKLIVRQKGIEASATGATVAMTALNIALGVATLAISAGVSIWMKYQQQQEEAMDKAKEAANTYKEQSENIDELIENYKELYKTLQNATSQSDVISTQEELLSLQEQIVDTYGAQAKGIDLVNGNLDVQLQKIRELQRETAKEYLQNPENKVRDAIDYMSKTSGRQSSSEQEVKTGFDEYIEHPSNFTHDEIQNAVTQAYDKATDQAEEIKEKLTDIFGEAIVINYDIDMPQESSIARGAIISRELNFGELTDEEYINTLQTGIDKLNDVIDKSNNPAVINYYEDLRNELYSLRDEVQNTDEYKLYSGIISDLPNQIATADESFESQLTGKTVDPKKILDSFSNRVELVNQLALSEKDKIIDAATGQEVTFDRLRDLIAEDYQNLKQYVSTLTGEEKEIMENYIQGLSYAFVNNKDLIYLKQYLKGDVEGLSDTLKITSDDILTDEEIDKLKEKSPEILKAIISGETTDSQITPIIEKIEKAMQGLDFTTEDLVNILTALGYTYKETEKITAAGLIENFSTDESEIKTITETIEKLNNVVKAASSGETIDLEELSALRDAGIDVSNIVAGGFDNVVEISKVRDDYIQSQINSLEEQIALNNQIMSQDSDITESEKQQIKFENQMIRLRIKTIKSATNAIKSNSNEYIESLKSANEIISRLVSYGETRISEDVLSDMVDQYADMAGYVEKYRLGMIDNDELLETFRKFYQNDIKNYNTYQKEKYVNTTEYFEQWLEDNKDWVNNFKEKYGIDLRQYKSYIEAKAAIKNQSSRMQEIEDEYDFSSYVDDKGNYTEQGEFFLKRAEYEPSIKEVAKVLEEYVNLKKEYAKELELLDEKYMNDTESDYIDMTEVYNDSIDEVVSRMKSAYSVINDLKENSNKVTLDTLDSMKSAYKGMGEYVNQYLAGKIDITELLNKFNEFYAKDKELYIYYQIQKLETDADMYSKFMNNSGVWIKKLRGDYKKDLANVSTYAEAKELILENLSDPSLNLASVLDLNFWETGEINQEAKDILSSFAQGISSGYDAQIYGKAQDALNDLSILVKEWTNWAEDDIEGLFNNLDDLLKDSTYSVEDALSDISSILSNEVDYWEQITNGIVAAAQLEIDALDKEIDLLEKKNEEQQRQIDLQEKLEALNRAKTQRSVREYNAETGQFEWTTNKKDIETAQREYDEALKEGEKQQLEDEKEWLEKYGGSFSSVSSTIESQRQINKAIQALADIRGVKASSLTHEDLLSMTEKEQSAIRSKYGSAVDMNLAFEEAQKQQDINKAKTNLVTGGYATNGANGFVLDYNALSNAIGVPFTKLASSLSGYTEILKSTSFAETKPTTSTVNNITNTGAVTNSYVLSGDMTFKFDGNMDVDGFITQLVTKLDEKVAITPLS